MATGKRLAILLVSLLLLLPGTTLAAVYTSLYVFGDSLLDSGNAHSITGVYPVSPPYDMRFSNGPVASEVLAQDLGLAALPSQLGGSNYATGGATSGSANFAGLVYGSLTLPPPFASPPPNQIALLQSSTTGGLSQQVNLFTSAPPADIGSSLVLVWAGANDLFLTSALVPTSPPPTLSQLEGIFTNAADQAAANVEGAINGLVGAGAKNILAVNLPDLGRIPAADTPLASFLWSLYANEFNSQFLDAGYLATLDASVNLTEFNIFELLNDVMADPSNNGFTNVTDACLPTVGPVPVASPCADPNEYLFWDSAHPTAAADRIIGDAFARAVPEPASIALLIFPLVALIARRSRI
jgi:phospholipase/lecithinase/hemolysin